MVTNLRQLNDITIKDAYPLTNIQEILQKLKGAKGACRLHPDRGGSRDCTAFISPFGTYRYIHRESTGIPRL